MTVKAINESDDEYVCDCCKKSVVVALRSITERSWGRSMNSNHYKEHNALEGPNNLLRHRLDDGMTVGHGEGPWDYVEREFS